MEKSQQYELIAQYLSGELSETAAAKMEAWLDESEANQQLFEELQNTWALTAQETTTYNSNTTKAWADFENKMDWADQTIQVDKPLKVSHRNPFRQLLRIAAVFILMAGFGFAIYNMQNTTPSFVSTHAGQHEKIELPDGSIIWLNENTTIRLADNFKTNRQVELTGEAFFEVARDEEHPFSIASGQTQTTVLGTAFNIRAYPDEQTVELSVTSGKVRFSEKINKQKPLILTKSQKGILDKRDWSLSQASPNADNINGNAWKTKTLIFENTKLKNVITTLERYYHQDLQVDNKAALNCPFTGEFKDVKLTEILNVIDFALNTKTTKEAQKYILLGGNACE